jgi:hypothetical protein
MPDFTATPNGTNLSTGTRVTFTFADATGSGVLPEILVTFNAGSISDNYGDSGASPFDFVPQANPDTLQSSVVNVARTITYSFNSGGNDPAPVTITWTAATSAPKRPNLAGGVQQLNGGMA